MSDSRCEKCGEKPAEITLHRSGRVWGRFCVPCHDTLAAVASGQLETGAASTDEGER